MPVFFHSDGVPFKLSQKTLTSNWVKQTLNQEGYSVGELSFVFCNDEYLYSLNETYLNHKTLTDIITFDYTDMEKKIVSGDVFISIERVKENSKEFSHNFADELHRIIIHGTLHLIGYKDKTKAAKEKMTQKEDYYLEKRPLKLSSASF